LRMTSEAKNASMTLGFSTYVRRGSDKSGP
jgi:hypothetical protein